METSEQRTTDRRTTIDQPTTVRQGEELDRQALAAYLAAALPTFEGELTIAQFPSGYSNLTYALQIGSSSLVLRRPPFGANIRSAHDMGREYRVLSGLRRVTNKVPRPLLYCEDPTIIGAPFYLMERVEGVILRAKSPNEALVPELMHQLSLAAIDTLAEIHALDYQAAGLGELGRPAGYVERQLRGWQRRYANVETESLPALETIITWLERNQPTESSAATLIHNDFKYDNLILDPTDLTNVRAVLDWEMCTLGDPLMDLGTTLGYWIEATDPPALIDMFGLTALPGNAHRGELVARYEATSGRAIQQPLFYYVYGLFKIAVIIQQIYHRYRQGNTTDARFANLDQVVRDCAHLATLALEKDRIYHLTQ